MFRLLVLVPVVMVISGVMAMTGRGGGNFYVPALIACGSTMHQAATTGQCILFLTAVAASFVFHGQRTIDWKLALVIDPPTDVMAFTGGYYARLLPGDVLKFVFAGFLVLTAFLMLRSVKERPVTSRKRFGYWRRQFGEYEYVVNLFLVLPITAATGLVAGMVGVSGGSFKVPLMVLACGVPMRVAVGTSSAMVAATALMGFAGHSAAGDLNVSWAIPASIAGIIGGILGGTFSLKTSPKNLKSIFAYTTLAAAAFMTINALLSVSN